MKKLTEQETRFCELRQKTVTLAGKVEAEGSVSAQFGLFFIILVNKVFDFLLILTWPDLEIDEPDADEGMKG